MHLSEFQQPAAFRSGGWIRKAGTLLSRLMAALPLLVSVAGCQERLTKEEATLPFVFRSLQLSQNDSNGRPAWTLNSPEARYDITRRLAQARQLRGTLYAEGRPAYQLSARSAVVLADGALIQFEGQVRLKRLGPEPLLISAERLRWYSREARMELDLRPVATQRDLTLSSEKALFLIDRELLRLQGRPRIQRVASASSGSASKTQEMLTIEASSADWFPSSGKLEATGPIQARRIFRGPDGAVQTLTSSSLRGNTLSQKLVLASPVRFQDPGASAQLDAAETHLDLQREQASSTKPFKGTIGRLTIQGQGFVLHQPGTVALIPKGCRLRQPGEVLSADRCRWNWTTQALEATGNVELQRQASDQTTRASRLDGRMGESGTVVFTSPGGRVNTRLRLQEQPAPGRPRSKEEFPVRL